MKKFCSVLAMICAPCVSFAETTLNCETADTGRPVLEIKHNRTVKTATVTYLESSEPREIAVTEGFIGYRVIGLRGDYSQMLQTRLEVYRAPETEDYKGLLWPIGASNAWQVICKETP